MRIFASDVIKRVMGTFGIPEDEPIYNSMITRSLEKAQTRIEELNFDARKHVLSYDDVLNIQRRSVYDRRRNLLTMGDGALDAELSHIAESNDGFAEKIEAKKKELGSGFYPIVRRFLLQTIDFLWVEHLEAMEYLRSSVNLRAYGQRDPLVEYKKEGLKLFQGMEATYAANVVQTLPTIASAGTPFTRSEQVVLDAAKTITSQNTAGKKGYGRNDRVSITNGKETREAKFKKIEELLAGGEWHIVEGG
jgi:preprotein translocase subunit SecA